MAADAKCVPVRLSKELRDRLTALYERGVSKSFLIREGLKLVLPVYERKISEAEQKLDRGLAK